MQHHLWRGPKAPVPPCVGQREVHARGKGVGETMERESGLVRDDACSVGPEPGGNQLLVFARGKVHHAIDAARKACDPPRANVVHEKLGRVPPPRRPARS